MNDKQLSADRLADAKSPAAGSSTRCGRQTNEQAGNRRRVKPPLLRRVLNFLDSKGNYSATATSNNTKLVYWPLMSGLLHLLHFVPNVTAHQSPASVPITVLIYDSPLLCVLMWRLKG